MAQPPEKVVAIGASAGGVEVLLQMVRDLPAGFPAAVLIVVHFPPEARSVLPQLLSRRGPLRAVHAVEGMPLESSTIYVAPPNHHMIVGDGVLHLNQGPKENHTRPAIDPTFRSAAYRFGPNAAGVILSGNFTDGTAGLASIKRAGGFAIVQDPLEALFPSMPLSATMNIAVDQVLKLADIVPALMTWATDPRDEKQPQADRYPQADDPMNNGHNGSVGTDDTEVAIIDRTIREQEHGDRGGEPTIYTCPECGGTLWQMDEDGVLRFRCHTGHAYAVDALLSEQGSFVEKALWSGIRALREKATLCKQLSNQMRERGNLRSSQYFEQRTSELEQQISVLHNIVVHTMPPPEASEGDALEEAMPPI